VLLLCVSAAGEEDLPIGAPSGL